MRPGANRCTMLLKHRPPGIDSSIRAAAAGLEHLEPKSIAVLRWLNRQQGRLTSSSVRSPTPFAGDTAARGPVAIVPAPYGRNYERLTRALIAEHAGLRSDAGARRRHRRGDRQANRGQARPRAPLDAALRRLRPRSGGCGATRGGRPITAPGRPTPRGARPVIRSSSTRPTASTLRGRSASRSPRRRTWSTSHTCAGRAPPRNSACVVTRRPTAAAGGPRWRAGGRRAARDRRRRGVRRGAPQPDAHRGRADLWLPTDARPTRSSRAALRRADRPGYPGRNAMSLPRRARIALIGAAISVVLLALTWYVSHYVRAARPADVIDPARLRPAQPSAARPADELHRRPVRPPVVRVPGRRPARSRAGPRGRFRVAVMIALVLLCANETTQLLKPLLAAPRDLVCWGPIRAALMAQRARHRRDVAGAVHGDRRSRPAPPAVAAAMAPSRWPSATRSWSWAGITPAMCSAASWWRRPGRCWGRRADALRGTGGCSPRPSTVRATGSRPSRSASVSIGEALTSDGARSWRGGGVRSAWSLSPCRPHGHRLRPGPRGVCGRRGAIAALGLMLASGLTLMLRRAAGYRIGK